MGKQREGEAACRLAVERLSPLVNGDETDRTILSVLAHTLAWQCFFGQALGRSATASELLDRAFALLERAEAAGFGESSRCPGALRRSHERVGIRNRNVRAFS